MAKMLLPEDFKDFLRLLNENEVHYLLIGGYAVGFYGYPRATHATRARLMTWISGSLSTKPTQKRWSRP